MLEELVVMVEGGKGKCRAEVDVEHKELGVLAGDQEQAAIVRVEIG